MILGQDVVAALDAALDVAQAASEAGAIKVGLSTRLKDALDALHDGAHNASAAFTAIVTCLAIKAARPDVDVRYHQIQIQKDTPRPAGVNFRGVSEKFVYPWMSNQRFQGAKSGWQTRTFERPKPFTMDYDENIAVVKMPFLTVFDELEEHRASAAAALSYLLYRQVVWREDVKIVLAEPKTDNIEVIVGLFQRHFERSYKGRGASRLPVLAIHAVYSVLINEMRRFDGKVLLDLNSHSAADSQTGSAGDVEVSDKTSGDIFECVEVKHQIRITNVVADTARSKIMGSAISRYYLLTTHSDSHPDAGAKEIIKNVDELYNCQIVANGVVSTLRYYLRLTDKPSAIFAPYVEHLRTDEAISHEHRVAWNEAASTL